jgi:PAS domain S-box-containing protein
MMRPETPSPNLLEYPAVIPRRLAASILAFLNASHFESNVVLLVGFFLAGQATLQLPHLLGRGVEIWPATGIAIAAFLLRGSSVGPFIFSAAFFVDAFATGSVAGALCMAAGQTIEGWLGARLLGLGADARGAFFNLRSVLRLSLVAAPVAAAVCSTIGALTCLFFGYASRAELDSLWLTWWQGHVIGAIVVTPVIVLIVSHHRHALDLAESAELLALMLGVIVLCVGIFSGTAFLGVNGGSMKIMLIPIFIWMGLRFCPMEVAIVNAIVAGFAIWNALHGLGPFPADRIPPYLMNVVVAVVSTSTLALSAVVAEKRQSEEARLIESVERNERAQAEIQRLSKIVDSYSSTLSAKSRALKVGKTTKSALMGLFDEIPEVVRIIDLPEHGTLYVSEAFEAVFGRPLESFRQEPRSWLEAVHPEDKDRISNFIRVEPGCHLQDTFEIEYRIMRPDNSVRWLRDKGVFIRDELGTVVRLVALASDVTEFKKLCRVGQPLSSDAKRSRRLAESTCYIHHGSSS